MLYRWVRSADGVGKTSQMKEERASSQEGRPPRPSPVLNKLAADLFAAHGYAQDLTDRYTEYECFDKSVQPRAPHLD